MTTKQRDFDFNNQGSICLLTPRTKEAEHWAAEFLPEDAMRWGPSIVIEPRYAGPIIEGIHEEGLTIQ
jgi:hypothetical protein